MATFNSPVELDGVTMRVSGTFCPEVYPSYDDPGDAAHFEDFEVWIGDQCINDILSEAMIDRIQGKVLEAMSDDYEAAKEAAADAKYHALKDEGLIK
jgi:hypothetical protein